MHNFKLAFGNPNIYHLQLLESIGLVDDLYSELAKITPPDINSDFLYSQIHDLAQKTQKVYDEKPELIATYRYHSHFYQQYIINELTKVNKDVNNVLTKLFKTVKTQILPLLTKLQFHFNQPNAQQLAHFFQIKYFSLNFDGYTSPNYPNADLILALTVVEIISNHYPELYSESTKIKENLIDGFLYYNGTTIYELNYCIIVMKNIINSQTFMSEHRL